MSVRLPLSLLLPVLLLAQTTRGDEPRVRTTGRCIDKSIVVAGPPRDVWRAWIDPKTVTRFFGRQARIELRLGGAYEMYFNMQAPEGLRGSEGCRILSYLPGEMLAFDWNAPPQIKRLRDADIRTQVVVRFDSTDGGTRVTLTHMGIGNGEDWDAYYDHFVPAWEHVLAGLQRLFKEQPSLVTSNPSTQPSDDSGILRQEVVINGPIDKVFMAMTTAKGIKSWMAAQCEIDRVVGGRMRTKYSPKGFIGDPTTIENIILAIEPPHIFSIKVGKPPEGFPFKIAADQMWTVMKFDVLGPKQTRVICAGVGYQSDEESQKLRRFFEHGNAWTLNKLKEHIENPAASSMPHTRRSTAKP